MTTHTIKEIAYDWLGYNKIIFDYLHNLPLSKSVTQALVFVANSLGWYALFPIHFLLLASVMVIYVVRNKHDIDLQIRYIKTICILLLSIVVGGLIVESAKIYFKLPRPYCSDVIIFIADMLNIAGLKSEKCYKSFPSGHSWYVMTFILSILGVLNTPLKLIGAIIVLLIGTSRVIVGMHFPADVIYGYAIALVTFFFADMLINKLLDVYRKRLENFLKKYLKKT